VLLIVMYETRTWRVNPGEVFTFGRAASSSAVLPSADYALSRRAGSFRFDADCWWVHNESGSALLYLTGDRDPVLHFSGGQERVLRSMRKSVADLRGVTVLPGCGHWVQQERPDEVNAELVRFLNEVSAG